MTTDTTLSDFLLARIAEDEEVARAATAGPWRSWVEGRDHFGGDDVVITQDTDIYLTHGTGVDIHERWATQDHIARHDPARVLAECEAKRRIVEVVTDWGHETVEDCWYSCAATYGTDVENACCDDNRGGTGCDCGLEYRVARILGPLALPYADHPDFREEWGL